MFCRNCGEQVTPGAAICVACGCEVGKGAKFCNHCGDETSLDARVCTHCGRELNVYSSKSKTTAGILGLLLGGFGIHRFYLGFTGIGIIQIVVTLVTCGAGAIWGFVEGILYLVGSMDEDAEGKKLIN